MSALMAKRRVALDPCYNLCFIITDGFTSDGASTLDSMFEETIQALCGHDASLGQKEVYKVLLERLGLWLTRLDNILSALPEIILLKNIK